TPGAPGATCATDSSTCVSIPAEPFGITLDEGKLPDGTRYSRLLVAHLSGGEVMLINAAAFDPRSTTTVFPDEAVVLDVSSPFFAADSLGRRGAFALAPRVAGDPASDWLVSSRVNPSVGAFRIAEVGRLLRLVVGTGFNVNNA